ncbi:MAG: hypothetical protein HY823_11055 [Acidobacteria bacterium]|nr:hypothetical protein [Acidobacteriota bacterium]
MGFFSKLLNREGSGPLPDLEVLLGSRGVPVDLPGLDRVREDFEHLRKAEDREHWADAVKELSEQGAPLPPPWLDAMDHLLPEVVPHWRAEREGRFFRPFCEGLCERVTLEGQAAPEAWFRLWGIQPQEAQDRARDHLAERSEGQLFERLPSGVYRCASRDGLEAARILLRDRWEKLFPGQPTFLAVPTPGTLLVAPQVLLPKLVDEIGKALQSGQPHLQAVILQKVDERLMPANLQDPHPIAQPQRELRQQDLLECLKVQDGDLDPSRGRCPDLGIVRTNQGRTLTMASWQEGRPVYLPETDLVAFLRKDGSTLGVFWRQTLPRITSLKGEGVEVWGPRRLRFEAFPTPEQLETLECFATAEQMRAAAKAQAPGAPPARPQGTPPPEASGVSLGASPVPAHLRGLSLGVQDGD